MDLEINHITKYRFEHPSEYGLQQVRLMPQSGMSQSVKNWEISIDGGDIEADYIDHNGNNVKLVQLSANCEALDITSHGQVEVLRDDGVVGMDKISLPNWYYLRQTSLTKVGKNIEKISAKIDASTDNTLSLLHDISKLISAKVKYQIGSSTSYTTAEQALTSGSGVCQDHTHIFLSLTRHLGFPSRYVSGYLMLDDRTHQDAMHAWAEVWIEHLGWVGLDISNRHSPDGRYIRIATGLDYKEAAPISGITYGARGESISIELQVQQ